ncbi:hypothetical protein Tco_1570406 [Tanacetum coccineum]
MEWENYPGQHVAREKGAGKIATRIFVDFVGQILTKLSRATCRPGNSPQTFTKKSIRIGATSDGFLSFSDFSRATNVDRENFVARSSFSCSDIEVDVNNFRFRCQSKDNDLGNVGRNAGEALDIKFCLNNKSDPDYCFRNEHESKDDRLWLVKEDGFYAPLKYFPGPNDWVKRFDRE